MKPLLTIIALLLAFNVYAGQPPEKPVNPFIKGVLDHKPAFVYEKITVYDTVFVTDTVFIQPPPIMQMNPIVTPQPYDSWTWVHLLGGYVLADLAGNPWASIGLTLTWEFGDFWSSKGKLPDPPWDKRGFSLMDAGVGIAGATIWALTK